MVGLFETINLLELAVLNLNLSLSLSLSHRLNHILVKAGFPVAFKVLMLVLQRRKALTLDHQVMAHLLQPVTTTQLLLQIQVELALLELMSLAGVESPLTILLNCKLRPIGITQANLTRSGYYR